jgi:hypothetical protein
MNEEIEHYTFIKEDTGRWYIDLPEWPGSKAELEMVEGADTMLDHVGEGNDLVELQLSETPFDGAYALKLTKDLSDEIGGGMYLLESYNNVVLNQEMWLCQVTEYVFGHLPPVIFFKKIA